MNIKTQYTMKKLHTDSLSLVILVACWVLALYATLDVTGVCPQIMGLYSNHSTAITPGRFYIFPALALLAYLLFSWVENRPSRFRQHTSCSNKNGDKTQPSTHKILSQSNFTTMSLLTACQLCLIYQWPKVASACGALYLLYMAVMLMLFYRNRAKA